MAEDYHTLCDQRNKVILLDLANNAPSDEVKAVIQTYNVDMNGDEIYKQMNKSSKPQLVDTAEYLNTNSNQLKDPLTRSIISKINSLLLELCNKCQQYYSALLGDEPTAVCECGQPCHESCYSDIKEVFTKYPGVVFQCARCLKAPTQNVTVKASTPVKPPDQTEDTLDPSKPEDQGKTFKLNVVSAFNLDLLQTMFPTSSPYKTCEKYKRNNCPHGRDGKIEIEGAPCRYLHPKKCYAWCKAGNDSTHGCNNGKECTYYHPVLCKYSVRYRRCLVTECTFTHLKFTKRYKKRTPSENLTPRQNEQHNPWSKQGTLPMPYQSRDEQENQKIHHSNEKPEHKMPSSDMTFLTQLIQSMKQDMQSVQSEVREFKHNITAQVSHIQSQTWSQNRTAPTHHHVQVDQSAATNQMQHYQQNLAANHAKLNQPNNPEQGLHLQYPHQLTLHQNWNQQPVN